MFNQLTPSEIVTAIGATVRGAARSDGQTSDFERDQLMSAYSATRHLAVELAAFEPEFRSFTATVAGLLHDVADPELHAELAPSAGALDVATDPGAVGAAVCEVMETLRARGSAAAEQLRTEVHVHLRALADREVYLLADALG
jgi:hypothetical protein